MCTALFLGMSAGSSFAQDNESPERDRQIDALVARMTAEEKAGQLSLYAPSNALIANPLAHLQTAAEQRADVRAGRITGFFNGAGLASKRELQTLAVKESRLGIPLLFGADVIHGFRTVFPVPLAEAASWEPALAQRTARAAAVEATADGFRWNFAPMVDIARDARWGRGVEGAGEDVLLGRLFAAARVRGFQTDDLSRSDAMLATPKHFAAYGAAEGGLDYNTVDISERTLREVYLPPFNAAFDAGAMSVMASFNEIAGIPSTENAALLGGVLRGEWGFRGITVSDYTGDEELIAHGTARNARDAAKRAFLAGTDVSMQSGLYMAHLPALVASGEVPMARLDDAVRRVLQVKWKLGLFSDPFRGLGAPGLSDSLPDSAWPAHQALARDAARRSIVLLKNEHNALPLSRNHQRIALIGPFGSRGGASVHGPWTLFAAEGSGVSLAQGLRAAMADSAALSVVAGSGVNEALPGGIAQAMSAARGADVVLLALGESEQMSGEARSRVSLEIPPAQQALAEAVSATVSGSGKPVIVLLRNGRALALQGAVRDAQAVLVTWFLGSEAGHAIADVLFGDYNPSGRLPVSFPRATGQAPYYYAHKPTGRPLDAAQPWVDYKARYSEMPNEALYPFGHGLGYAAIRYGRPELSTERLPWNDRLRVRARIINTGTRAAEEVVQLYVRDRSASVTRPIRELNSFQKLHLAAGACVQVEFSVGRGDLSFIGPALLPITEPGEFDLWVGPSATEGERRSFELLAP